MPRFSDYVSLTVYFDQHNPRSEKWDRNKPPSDALDYSSLPRITWRSLLVALFVSMGGLLFGYDTGQISGFLAMPDYQRRFAQPQADGTYAFSDVRSGLIVGLLSIGTLIGALVSAPIADRIGRKYTISFWTLVIAVGFIIQISATYQWVQVMMGRFVTGLGVGALSLLVPMYQAETAPPWIRGAMVCTYQLFITLGIFLAACFNYGTVTNQRDSSASWRIVIGLGWLFVLVLGIGILFFPETPRYDYAHGHYDRARETLCRVYGAPPNHWSIVTQIEEIETKLRAEKHVKGSPVSEFVTMWRAPRMAYRILLGVALQMFQQLSKWGTRERLERDPRETRDLYDCLLTTQPAQTTSSTTARPSSSRSASTASSRRSSSTRSTLSSPSSACTWSSTTAGAGRS